MGSVEVNAFLTHLAVEGRVSASTQSQALTRPRLPVVMTVEEVRAVLERLEGVEALVAGVLYGGGLRL
ncbi:MAG: hypothetical protein RLZZ206_507 [Cyanobacteriota bacterium]|jgi:hypothetical protein